MCLPLYYHYLEGKGGFNGPINPSQASSFDVFWAAASPWPLTSDFQPLIKWYWPAIFSGTPGKFEAIISGQPH